MIPLGSAVVRGTLVAAVLGVPVAAAGGGTAVTATQYEAVAVVEAMQSLQQLLLGEAVWKGLAGEAAAVIFCCCFFPLLWLLRRDWESWRGQKGRVGLGPEVG